MYLNKVRSKFYIFDKIYICVIFLLSKVKIINCSGKLVSYYFSETNSVELNYILIINYKYSVFAHCKEQKEKKLKNFNMVQLDGTNYNSVWYIYDFAVNS